MNAVEQLLDLKAALVQNVTEENLFAFSIALLDAPLFIPCEFQMSEPAPDFSDISQFKPGTVLAWKGPDYKPLTVDFAEKINKQYKNSLDDLLPKKMIPIIIEWSAISPEKKVNEISKIMKISESNIKYYLFNSRKKIKERYNDKRKY